jgi:hypothetical protein
MIWSIELLLRKIETKIVRFYTMLTLSEKCFGSFSEETHLLHIPIEATRLNSSANQGHPSFPQLVLLS